MKILKQKKSVFGLTSVQLFFATILGIALLAYVIVIIMGTLGGTTILSQQTGTVINETGYVNETAYTLTESTANGFTNPVITALWNLTSGVKINGVGNASVTNAGVVTNGTALVWNNVSISYTYNYNTDQQDQLNAILTNTSTGITGFFGSISPVYAILAVLVIILVLVVLVRVVQAPQERSTPQL